MKKIIYSFINKLGYRIEKKIRDRKLIAPYLNKFNIEENYNILFDAKFYIKNLDNKFKNLTIKNHNDGFIIGFLDLNIYVESVEEFFILNEIFIREDYNFISGSQSIVIDIGANIGITSLFFSRLDYVDKIYGFEPVKDTFDQAQYNLALNKDIQKVFCLKNIGLGKNPRKEVFVFDKECKGNTGIRGLASPSYSNNSNARAREVIIASATAEIGEIIKENQDRRVVVKMDCEGGEYEILEDLYESGLINKIDVLILEWHDQGSKSIEKTLLDSGFDYFLKNFDSSTGMIYAFKKAK
jgi:FkbM family methyltransferase